MQEGIQKIMKAIFLDRDGVINELVYHQEQGVIDSPFTVEQFRLLPGVGKAISKFHEMGYKVIVVSNQPGIAKGHLSWETFDRIGQKMKEELSKETALVDREYYCFHHPEAKVDRLRADCECRKPKPGLLLQAAQDMSIDLSRSWLIGDNLSDIKAGKDVGCQTILLGKMKCELCHLMDKDGATPDFICLDLLEATGKVLAEIRHSGEPSVIEKESNLQENTRQQLYARRCNIGGLEEERIRKSIEVFKKLEGDRFLDVGCADGAITIHLMQAMKAKEACGVDIAPGAVAAAEQRGVRAFCVDLDNEGLPFEDECFDVVYAGEILEHVFSPDHLLNEVRRVLKRGGNLVVTTPNLAGWSNRFALLFGFQPYPTAVSPNHEGTGKLFLKGEEGQWGHIRVFTLKALKEMVSLYGFAIQTVNGCSVAPKSNSRLTLLVKFLDRSFAKFPDLASKVLLVLRKNRV